MKVSSYKTAWGVGVHMQSYLDVTGRSQGAAAATGSFIFVLLFIFTILRC